MQLDRGAIGVGALRLIDGLVKVLRAVRLQFMERDSREQDRDAFLDSLAAKFENREARWIVAHAWAAPTVVE
jgi:hypothetical protein